MKNFVQPGHVVTVTASAGGVAAASPVLYPIGTATKAAGTLAATVRMRLNDVAVTAAGA
jgi:predicted RecA/RadA family phage recombinase